MHVTKDLRAYSIHKAYFYGSRATQNSKPSNLGGVKSDLNYSGRTRARGSESGGGFRLHGDGEGKKKSYLPSFRLPLLWEMFFLCKHCNNTDMSFLCFQLAELVNWDLDFGRFILSRC